MSDDRSDELRELIAEDERRERAIRDGQDPDDPGPSDPPEQPELPLVWPAASSGRSDPAIPVVPELWLATDLKPAAQPQWLAKNRIPRAAVSLICGEEGIGKSLLWVWIVAAITTGSEVAGFGIPARAPGQVIVAAITEDDWCSVVRPRLEVARADLSMIRVICAEADGSGAPLFPRDLQLIRDAEPRPDYVVVDAWLDTVPASLNVRDTQQARQALHPWKDVATLTGAAISLVCHTNRLATPKARDSYGASAALRQKARLSLYCQTDDDDNLIVGPEKANGSRAVPASVFSIEPVPMFPATADDDGSVPRLVYGSESDLTARQHFTDAYTAGHDAADSKADILGWLAAYLGDGPRWVDDIMRVGEPLGYSKDRLKRAKRPLHVESVRDSTIEAWFWRLPQHQGRTPVPISPPLLPCSLAFQESISISKESKRVSTDTWTDDGDDRSLAQPVTCRYCGTEIPEDRPLARANGYCSRGACIARANNDRAAADG